VKKLLEVVTTMFDWLNRLFRRGDGDERRAAMETVDTLNAIEGGGNPVVVKTSLGNLKVPSGILVLGDPQCVPSLEVQDIAVAEVAISATLWQYPTGPQTVTALKIRIGNEEHVDSRRKIGAVAIDSAKLVVTDKCDVEKHWQAGGKERMGVIRTLRDDGILKLLQKRFKLKTSRVNAIRAEVVGPVSEALEKEIVEYLKSIPRYADYPFMYFSVQTNNSFDRINYMTKPWGFLPIGNESMPVMFACGTGRGDAVYNVLCGFAAGKPSLLSIVFVEDGGD
jgi:hypothetical protein